MSINLFVERTDAIGIYTKQGKTGGTYAHKDIAFEFGTAISPIFKLYVIKEFQRLKEADDNKDNIDWLLRRYVAKSQYVIQTDAIKNYKIPMANIPQKRHSIAYAEEGDILNLALFGFTAKAWREKHPELAMKGRNAREYASVNELIVLASLEGINAELIKDGMCYDDRLRRLYKAAQDQLLILNKKSEQNMLRKDKGGQFVIGLPFGTVFPVS